MAESLEKLIGQKKAAERLDIHPETLRRLSVRGEIPSLKIGRFWKYLPSALDAWVRSRLNSSRLSCRTGRAE